MRRRGCISFMFALILSLAAVEGGFGQGSMELYSPAFKDGGQIPQKYAMKAIGGENISPPLVWKDSPKGTKSFAISIVDHHPVANNWVHWLVIDIAADVDTIPEGASGKAMPAGSAELMNSYGSIGYGGPQPPKGTGEHPYAITLYALSVDKLNLDKDASLRSFHKALRGKILAESKITGHYGQ